MFYDGKPFSTSEVGFFRNIKIQKEQFRSPQHHPATDKPSGFTIHLKKKKGFYLSFQPSCAAEQLVLSGRQSENRNMLTR